MFYNYCTVVPDADSVRRRLLPTAGCVRQHNQATYGGIHAVNTVSGNYSVIRLGEVVHV